MQPSELPIEYACRLKKLFYLTYPLSERNKANMDTLRKLEEVLKDKCVDGLPLEIRHKVRDKTFKTFDELVQFTGRKASNHEEERKEKNEIRRIADIHSEYRTDDKSMAALVQELNILSSQIHELDKQVAATQRRQEFSNGEPHKVHFQGQQPQQLGYARGNGYIQNNFQNNQRGSQQPGRLMNSDTRYYPEQCGFCGTYGHHKEDCNKLVQKERFCFKCNLPGNMNYDCSSRNAQGVTARSVRLLSVINKIISSRKTKTHTFKF